MTAGGDAAKDAAIGRYCKPLPGRVAEQTRRELSRRARQHEAGKTEGERRLADAPRPGQQQSMRQPVLFEEPAQRGFGRFMAKEVRVGARWRRYAGIGFLGSAAAAAHGATPIPSRSLTAASIARWTLSRSPAASISTQRCGSAAAIRRKPSRRRP